ncbi:Uma2 family endonuclease [Sphaerothrix gracilis]|uniref:Uma2 family endonuclease n=1 Tax=Sphaerothrix gracilis TaxID=3151835 RepID=UPI0031FD7F90
MELYGPPTLTVELGASFLNDELGFKRLRYERLGVREYWVINVVTQEVIAFSIAAGRADKYKFLRCCQV